MHRRSKRILTGLGAVIVLLGVIYAAMMVRATARLRRAYAALEAARRPLRTAEVIPPEVPDTENAAVLYRSAILMLKGQNAGQKNLLERLGEDLAGSLFQKPTDPDKLAKQQREEAELRQLMDLEIVASALSTIEQGTQRPACQFDRDYNASLSFEMPILKDLRNLGRVLGTRICLDVEAGETRKAWETMRTLLRFADALRSDPTTNSQWTRTGLINYSTRTIQHLCDVAPPPPEESREIEALLSKFDDTTPFVRALDGERILIGEWFFALPKAELDTVLQKETKSPNKIAPESVEKFNYRIWFTLAAFRPRLITDHAAYLEVMRRRVELFEAPYQGRRAGDDLMRPALSNHLTGKLIGYFGYEKEFFCRMSAGLRMTRAGLALLRQRQAHGAFPETLDVLGLKGLIDPFDEKPLRYRREGEGFLVYSVGDDQHDNGGTPQPEYDSNNPRRNRVEYDFLWRFPKPKDT